MDYTQGHVWQSKFRRIFVSLFIERWISIVSIVMYGGYSLSQCPTNDRQWHPHASLQTSVSIDIRSLNINTHCTLNSRFWLQNLRKETKPVDDLGVLGKVMKGNQEAHNTININMGTLSWRLQCYLILFEKRKKKKKWSMLFCGPGRWKEPHKRHNRPSRSNFVRLSNVEQFSPATLQATAYAVHLIHTLLRKVVKSNLEHDSKIFQ